jgi:hypothetical protein
LLVNFRKKAATLVRKINVDLILLVSLLSLILSIVISQTDSNADLNNLNYFSPFTRIWEFGFGAMVAKIQYQYPVRKIARWRIAKIYSLVCIVGLAFLINSRSNYPGLVTLFPVICASVYLYVEDKSKVNDQYIHIRRFLSKVGDMSYSIYLWHWPFVVLAKAVWENVPNIAIYATIASLAPAYVAYKFIEIPIRDKSKSSSMNLKRSIVVWTFVPLLLAMSTWFIASKYWEPKFQSFLVQTQNFTSVNGACHFDSGRERPEICIFNSASVQRPIYLIGDSNAAHFGPGLEIVANRAGRPLIVSTAASCPVIDGEILFNGGSQVTDCKVHYAFIMNLLEKREPGLVFVSFSDRYFTDPQYELTRTSLNNSSKEINKYQQLIDSFGLTLRQIQSLGHEVVFINPIPYFSNQYNWNPRTCLIQELLNSCEQVMPLDFSRKIQDPFVTAIKGVTQSYKVKNVDLSKTICPNSICKTKDSEGWVYSDATHLTNSFSRRINSLLFELTSD